MRKPVLAAHEPGEVADQRAMRDQRALGRAGGAAGVDQHRGVVGRGVHAVARAAPARAAPSSQSTSPCPRAPPTATSCAAPGNRARAARTLATRSRRRSAHTAPLSRSRYCKRVDAEQHRQRHGHGAEPVHRHVRDRGLDALRQHDRHAVAALHAQAAQQIGGAFGLRAAAGRRSRAAACRRRAHGGSPPHRACRAPSARSTPRRC